MLNWDKIKLVGKVFSRIRRGAEAFYRFEHVPAIQKYIGTVGILHLAELEALAAQVENSNL